MKIRFQADNDLNYFIVLATRRLDPGLDFQSATEASLHGVPDELVLELATRENRVLVSHDKKTMPKHFFEFISKTSSPGLIVVSRKMSVGRASELLHIVWSASETEEYVNKLVYLG